MLVLESLWNETQLYTEGVAEPGKPQILTLRLGGTNSWLALLETALLIGIHRLQVAVPDEMMTQSFIVRQVT